MKVIGRPKLGSPVSVIQPNPGVWPGRVRAGEDVGKSSCGRAGRNLEPARWIGFFQSGESPIRHHSREICSSRSPGKASGGGGLTTTKSVCKNFRRCEDQLANGGPIGAGWGLLGNGQAFPLLLSVAWNAKFRFLLILVGCPVPYAWQAPGSFRILAPDGAHPSGVAIRPQMMSSSVHQDH